jgi:hypothetical protein
MTWLLSIAGTLLVCLTLRDIFHTLWHPHGFGSLGRQLFVLVWWLTGRRRTEVAGPLGILLVVGVWAAIIVAGFTLIYLPHMPEGFNFGSSLQPARSSDLVESVYLSLVTVGTLGYGDITPAYPALRMLAPLQALMGFVLFTAAISWVLQVYPALSRRRALAKRLSIMAETDTVGLMTTGDPSVVTQLLHSLVDDLLTVRVDLLQYGETYYFAEVEPDLSLAANLPYALDLVAAGKQSDSPDVRHHAAMLGQATENIASSLTEYVDGATPREVLHAFAEDHGHRVVRG